MRLFESLGKLDPPLDPRSVHLEKGDTHDVNDKSRDEGEDALPDLLRVGPQVAQRGVKLRGSDTMIGLGD
jgi:hypothetical protein